MKRAALSLLIALLLLATGRAEDQSAVTDEAKDDPEVVKALDEVRRISLYKDENGNVTKVLCRRCTSEQMTSAIVLMKNLTHLKTFHDNSMAYGLDSGIGNLTELEELEVWRNKGLRVWLGDDSLRPLRSLKKLKTLKLYSLKRLKDKSLEDIAGLELLEELVISGSESELSDAALQIVGGLKSLKKLRLTAWPLQNTSDGLKHLAKLDKLESLYFAYGKADDAGLAHLSGLARLEELSLPYASITDAGAIYLAKLRNLRSLNLNGTAIGDEGLKHIAKLPKLETLYLEHTKVTDAGVEHLTELKNLKYVSLVGNNISKEAAEKFRAAMPNTTLIRGRLFGIPLAVREDGPARVAMLAWAAPDR